VRPRGPPRPVTVLRRQAADELPRRSLTEICSHAEIKRATIPRYKPADRAAHSGASKVLQNVAGRIADPALLRLAARVGRRLAADRQTVTTAESCTGGWIAKALTDVAGSSQWFLDGLVTYSNQSKIALLGVPAAALLKFGAVSEATVRAMATGALQRAGAERSVAVTGIAGPGGAVPGKPVGTVWLAWGVRRGRRVHVVVELRRFRGDREAVRRKTVRAALEGLLRR
jgi:nicotinamide-nucleotide amidase